MYDSMAQAISHYKCMKNFGIYTKIDEKKFIFRAKMVVNSQKNYYICGSKFCIL